MSTTRTIGRMKEDGMTFAKALGEQFGELLRTLTAIVVKMLIVEGIVLLIKSFTTGGSDAAKGFGKRVLSGVAESFGIKLPEFKDGGIVSGPTLGLVGEYPGASERNAIDRNRVRGF